MIKSYVISLPSASQRRAHIIQEFAEKQIPFEFFDAFSPSERMNETASELIPALLQNTTLTNGEKGCLLSHLALWKKCVDNNLDYIAVFEDDIFLSDDASLFLKSEIYPLNSLKPTIIRYETYKMPVRLYKKEKYTIEGRDLSKLLSPHWGTAGYLINFSAAKYLLDFLYFGRSEDVLPVDKIMFEKMLNNEEINIYQLSPAICIQDVRLNGSCSELNSMIGERQGKSDKKTNTIISKLLKEFGRLKRNVSQTLNQFKIVKYQ